MRPVPIVIWCPGDGGYVASINGQHAGHVWQVGGRWRGRLTGAIHGFRAGRNESAAMATFIGRWRRWPAAHGALPQGRGAPPAKEEEETPRGRPPNHPATAKVGAGP